MQEVFKIHIDQLVKAHITPCIVSIIYFRISLVDTNSRLGSYRLDIDNLNIPVSSLTLILKIAGLQNPSGVSTQSEDRVSAQQFSFSTCDNISRLQ